MSLVGLTLSVTQIFDLLFEIYIGSMNTLQYYDILQNKTLKKSEGGSECKEWECQEYPQGFEIFTTAFADLSDFYCVVSRCGDSGDAWVCTAGGCLQW